MLNPYREPVPDPNQIPCVICKYNTDYAMSLKHPSDIGSHKVCSMCIDSFNECLQIIGLSIEHCRKCGLGYKLCYAYDLMTHQYIPNELVIGLGVINK